MRRIMAILLAIGAGAACAEEADKTFVLTAPPALQDSGLLAYIVPRFSLKTGVRITLGPDGDARFGEDGKAMFRDPDTLWRLALGEDPDALRFADWLRSDVGRKTVDGFERDGARPFSSEVTEEVAVAPLTFDGDAVEGERLSQVHCGRCHVIGEANRMRGIGSTPSFMVLRTLRNWEDRFAAFYVLKPHPAFTQIDEVTPDFDPSRPSPIAPMQMTLDDLEAIMAYVAALAPADLGAPIQSQ